MTLGERISAFKKYGIKGFFGKIPEEEKVVTKGAIHATAPEPSGASTLLAAITGLAQHFGKGAATWFSQQLKTESNAEARDHITKAAEEFKAGHKEEGLAHATKGILMVLPDAAYDSKTWSLLAAMVGAPIDSEKTVEALRTLKDKSADEMVAFMKESITNAGSGKIVEGILSQVSQQFSETLTDLINGNGQKAGEFLSNVAAGATFLLTTKPDTVNQNEALSQLGSLSQALQKIQSNLGTALTNLTNTAKSPLTLNHAG